MRRVNKLTLLLLTLILVYAILPRAQAEPYLPFVDVVLSPENPTIYDEVFVTVTFTFASMPPYVEEFGELTQDENVFSIEAKVFMPAPDEYVTQIIHSEEKTFYLGMLPAGSYRFNVYVYYLHYLEGYCYLVSSTTFEVTNPHFEVFPDIIPPTLNLYYPPKWASFYLEINGTYIVEDVNASSLILNDTLMPFSIINGDHNGNGVPDLKIKFDGEEFSSYIQSVIDTSILPVNVTLTLNGNFNDGLSFETNIRIQVMCRHAPSYGKAGVFPI